MNCGVISRRSRCGRCPDRRLITPQFIANPEGALPAMAGPFSFPVELEQPLLDPDGVHRHANLEHEQH